MQENQYAAQLSAADLENERLTEQASLASFFFEIRGQDALQRVLNDTVEADKKSLELTQALYDTGIDDQISVVQAQTALQSAHWPGNLDHLAGVVANLRTLRTDVTPEHVKRLLGEAAAPAPPVTPEIAARFFELPLREAREAFERLYFEQLLGREQSNMSKVAEKAGLERTHLYRKLKALGLPVGRREE